MSDCLYFGCWNQPGHFLFLPGGHNARDDRQATLYGNGLHLDGTLAPRQNSTGQIFCVAEAPPHERDRWQYSGRECPQGQFLRHTLDNGFSAIQWWDRCQGDTRGACNSTILLRGERTTAELLAALAEHFPAVLGNLKKNGVELVEVQSAWQLAHLANATGGGT